VHNACHQHGPGPGPILAARVGPALSTGQAGCDVCLAAAKGWDDYVSRAFHGRTQILNTGEAIADALGYCADHAARLSGMPSLAAPISAAFGHGVMLVQRLLDEAFFQEERLQRMVFGAGMACPACRFESQRAAREFAKTRRTDGKVEHHEWTCFHHQLAMGRLMAPAAQMEWLAECDRWLGREARSAANHCDGARDILARLMGEHAISARAIPGHMACGDDIADLIGHPDACPLCRWQDAATLRWLNDVALAGRFGEGGWLLFPNCAVHTGFVLGLATPVLDMALAEHALGVARAKLHREMAAVAACLMPQTAPRPRRLPRGRWLPRQTNGRRRRESRPLRCPGCEREAVAVERAAGTLLELLNAPRWRKVFADGHGLCMKHFAFVLPLAPEGIVRTWLVADQRARLGRLRDGLDTAPSDAWQAALLRFSGDRRSG